MGTGVFYSYPIDRIIFQVGYPVDSSNPNLLWFRFLGSPVNNLVVGYRFHGDGLLHQTVEELAPAPRRSTIESESKLVEVVIQMFVTDRSVMSPISQRLRSDTTRCTRGRSSDADFFCPRSGMISWT
jgi:hypothetical protein